MTAFIVRIASTQGIQQAAHQEEDPNAGKDHFCG